MMKVVATKILESTTFATLLSILWGVFLFDNAFCQQPCFRIIEETWDCEEWFTSEQISIVDTGCGGCDAMNKCAQEEGMDYVEGNNIVGAKFEAIWNPGMMPSGPHSENDICGYVINCSKSCIPRFNGVNWTYECVVIERLPLYMPFHWQACAISMPGD
jgi:hypothetical protein